MHFVTDRKTKMAIGMKVVVLSIFAILPSTEGARIRARDLGPPKVFCHYRICVTDAQPLLHDITAALCTHVVFSEAHLENNGMEPCHTDDGLAGKVDSLKRRGVHPIIKLGGWHDSDSIPNRSKYSVLIENPASRKEFIKNAASFLEKYGFDGLEIEWLYPVCWKADCSRGGLDDKENFATWLKEIKEEFEPRGWTLSAAVSQLPHFADRAYYASSLSLHLDWITVLTSYYHGNWDKVTGINSPLFPYPGATFDTDSSVNYWVKKGVTRDKLVISVPFYGVAVTLKDEKRHGIGDEIVGAGNPGERFYNQLCELLLSGEWTSQSDPSLRIGSYAYRGNQWASFDDKAMVERKGEYVRDSKLGGVAALYLQYDDYESKCGTEAYPLLKALNKGLRSAGKPPNNCLGTSTDHIIPFVINGELAKIEDYPYMVSLQREDGSHFCGGVILEKNIVMTAAHCVENKKPEEIRVVAGRTCQSQDNPSEQISASESFVQHEEYIKTSNRIINDIALIKVTNNFKWRKEVQPARLVPDWEYNAGIIVTVAGWGLTERGIVSDNLLKADLETASDFLCRNQYGGAYLQESTFCLFKKGKDSCNGDSGGPIITQQGEVIGLVSYGKLACGMGASVATKIGRYVSWIENQISLLSK